jgi:acyl carrier protein
MINNLKINRGDIANIVISTIQEVALESKTPLPPWPLEEDTELLGPRAVLDSMGLVTLIVVLEQKIEEAYRILLALATEQAMSQENIPFQDVRSLTDHICSLLEEESRKAIV